MKLKSMLKLVAEKIVNQKKLSFHSLYEESVFDKISTDSENAGKSNSHFLTQNVYDTIKDGSKAVNADSEKVFREVGDCDEKPKW